jgi:phosphonoacetaldehyde hydrolase
MKLRAVVLDWAGTIVDFGSRAPVAAIECVFAAAGVPVTIPEVRESMGLAKKAHMRSILEIPRVRQAWALKHGYVPAETDVERLYAEFVPSQIRVLANHSQLIPGVAEAVARMRARELKIGTTTGYNRAMLDYLLGRAAAQGFVPDSAVCPDDVRAGRPLPWMCYLTAMRLDVYPLWAFVKIGDTPADIEEGRNAGMWTIGVTRTGNETGLTEQEWSQLSGADRERLSNNARQRLEQAGAHYTVPSLVECESILDAIDARLAQGERP